MVVEKMETMRDCLVTKVWEQMCHLDTVNTKEMGEVVDMIKDFETALYYHSLVKDDDDDEEDEDEELICWSANCKKKYMEDKKNYKDINCKVKDLEEYVHSLDKDIIEMMVGFSPEEHRALHQQMSSLVDKISHMQI